MTTAKTPTRGFTLLEMMVVVGIIGILAALATTGVMYGTGKARTNNATFELTSMVSVAQMRAMANATPHYLLVWDQGGELGVSLLEIQDAPTGPGEPADWLAVDPLDHDAISAKEVLALPLSSRGGLAPFPLADLGTTQIPTPFPEPFQVMPYVGTSTSGPLLQQACSFCVAGASGTLGVIKFLPNGFVQLRTGDTTQKGATLALGASVEGEGSSARVVTIAVPSSSVKVFR